MKLKSLTRQAVRMAATTLMLAEGSTTTLHVKAYLRDQDYRATQADVSSWLFRIARRERWVVNDNGQFRVYYFPNFISQLSGPVSVPGMVVN
ncbi:hypothetical protein [Fibrella aquatilis]|uniref:Uncharacterized protein n=1 Tax=Fibrella aquatilis TaxID=2817059 RepID=A0A939G1D0_9BACT|nr:hypothetical protein [Fibrella aquatilis]MBO0930627.1 hypothetical protein [Fibrella aquatilis]